MPKRIQRKRTKGWKMPENAVYVGRPTKWGNHWTVKKALLSRLFKPEAVHEIVVREFEAWLTTDTSPNNEHLGVWHQPEMKAQREYILKHIHELRDKDLACWCPLDKPCHADVLLKLANKELSHGTE